MSSKLLWWRCLACLCIYLGANLTTLLPLNTAYAQARTNAQFHVRVLIITMFFRERDAWLDSWTTEHYKKISPSIGPVGDEDGAVYCHTEIPNGPCDGIYLTMTGTEKVNAATSMTAVLGNPKFSFKGAYFMTTGTAGTSPYSRGTLGFVALAHWIADRDQGLHVIPTSGYPFGYNPPNTTYPDNTADFQLNARLVNQAYRLTRNLKLTDEADLLGGPWNAIERAKYPGQKGRKPFVAMCDTITSDSYIVGHALSKQTKYITKTVTDTPMPARYCTMENEDSAVAGALNRSANIGGVLGAPEYLQCYLNLRAASAFDQPPPGESIQKFLTPPVFRANKAALANLLTVGSVVISELFRHQPCSND